MRVVSPWLPTAAVVLAVLFTAARVAEVVPLVRAAPSYVPPEAGRMGVSSGFFTSSPLTAAAIVGAYLVTCLWLTRARERAQGARPDARFERGPVWTWLGWWVPVVALWFPYQVVRDLRAAAARRGTDALLKAWWVCWLASGVTFYNTMDIMLVWQVAGARRPRGRAAA